MSLGCMFEALARIRSPIADVLHERDLTKMYIVHYAPDVVKLTSALRKPSRRLILHHLGEVEPAPRRWGSDGQARAKSHSEVRVGATLRTADEHNAPASHRAPRSARDARPCVRSCARTRLAHRKKRPRIGCCTPLVSSFTSCVKDDAAGSQVLWLRDMMQQSGVVFTAQFPIICSKVATNSQDAVLLAVGSCIQTKDELVLMSSRTTKCFVPCGKLNHFLPFYWMRFGEVGGWSLLHTHTCQVLDRARICW